MTNKNINITKNTCFNISTETNKDSNGGTLLYSRLIGNKLCRITRKYSDDSQLVQQLSTLSNMNAGQFEYFADLQKSLELDKAKELELDKAKELEKSKASLGYGTEEDTNG